MRRDGTPVITQSALIEFSLLLAEAAAVQQFSIPLRLPLPPLFSMLWQASSAGVVTILS